MKNIFLVTAFVVAALMFESCSRRTYVVGPPPPPRYEYIPVAPSPRHVWIGGHYTTHHRHYVWVPGRYAIRGYRGGYR